MIWIDKKAFNDTYKVLKKEKLLDPIYEELRQFAEVTFGIKVFNIVLEPIKRNRFDRKNKNSYLAGCTYKLIFYVGSYAERELMQNQIDVYSNNFPKAYKMVNDPDKQDIILNKLFELSVKYNFKIEASKKDIWVDYFYWFSSDYMSLIVSKVKGSLIKEVLSKYKKEANIWEIHTGSFRIVTFYDTDSNKLIHQENGISEQIKNMLYSKVKEKDEFDFYKEEYITFDTKENLDKNYQGSLFYYFK